MKRLAMIMAVGLGPSIAFAQEAKLGSEAVTWEQIQARPLGANGWSRGVLRAPTATLDELEIHVTAVPAGKSTHPPHTHPNEEVIIIREGTLDAFQNGKTTRVGPGAILFQASNHSHNLVNVGETTAVYHVINWRSPGMPKQAPATAPHDAVRAFYREWSKATMERGAEGYASYFAEDGVLLPPDAPPVNGRAAIREWQDRQQREATHRTVPEAITEDELQAAGDWVIYRGTLKGRRVPKAGGADEPFENKILDVLRRKADGNWEFLRRMWSSNRPRPASTETRR
jgi:uncharacterized protein (TIGR02246 family)